MDAELHEEGLSRRTFLRRAVGLAKAPALLALRG